jgi:hypothetical protein
MPSGHRAYLTCTAYAAVDDLPEAALALFGGDFFSGATWYRTLIAAGVPAGSRAVLLVFSNDSGPRAVFPMMVSGHDAGSLTSPYTCRWRPLLAPDFRADEKRALWRGFAQWCRQFDRIRLEAMDVSDAAALRAPGFAALRFDHFGNWHERAGRGWAAYLAARPGPTREAVRRRGKKLMAAGAVFSLVTTPADIDAGIAAYQNVYAKSWKVEEPFPAFNPALMRACAADGSLRLGLLMLNGAVLAAQFWVVRGDWAAVLKLAHDEAEKAQSPGTVLTAQVIEALMNDAITELDFGRGDDAYKASWTTNRRQRVGVVLANPATLPGLALIARHQAGSAIRVLRKVYAGVRPVPGK